MKTQESKDKASATREANKAIYADQKIKVGDFTVQRHDEYNWTIIRKGKTNEPAFYGHLIDALQALPKKMLDEGPKKTLEGILDQAKLVRVEIAMLFNLKFDHFKPVDGEGA